MVGAEIRFKLSLFLNTIWNVCAFSVSDFIYNNTVHLTFMTTSYWFILCFTYFLRRVSTNCGFNFYYFTTILFIQLLRYLMMSVLINFNLFCIIQRCKNSYWFFSIFRNRAKGINLFFYSKSKNKSRMFLEPRASSIAPDYLDYRWHRSLGVSVFLTPEERSFTMVTGDLLLWEHSHSIPATCHPFFLAISVPGQ